MRNAILLAIILLLRAAASHAEIAPEETSVASLGPPTNDWFIKLAGVGGYLFDSADGNMLGMLSLTTYTPALTFLLQAESRRA